MTFRVTPHPSTIAVLVVLEYISTLTSTSTPTHYQDELISTTLSIVYSHSTTLPKDWEEFKQLYVTRDGQDHEQLDNVVQGWYQSLRRLLRQGSDGLMDWIQNDIKHLSSPHEEEDETISPSSQQSSPYLRTSPFGLYIRRQTLSFEKMSFEEFGGGSGADRSRGGGGKGVQGREGGWWNEFEQWVLSSSQNVLEPDHRHHEEQQQRGRERQPQLETNCLELLTRSLRSFEQGNYEMGWIGLEECGKIARHSGDWEVVQACLSLQQRFPPPHSHHLPYNSTTTRSSTDEDGQSGLREILKTTREPWDVLFDFKKRFTNTDISIDSIPSLFNHLYIAQTLDSSLSRPSSTTSSSSTNPTTNSNNNNNPLLHSNSNHDRNQRSLNVVGVRNGGRRTKGGGERREEEVEEERRLWKSSLMWCQSKIWKELHIEPLTDLRRDLTIEILIDNEDDNNNEHGRLNTGKRGRVFRSNHQAKELEMIVLKEKVSKLSTSISYPHSYSQSLRILFEAVSTRTKRNGFTLTRDFTRWKETVWNVLERELNERNDVNGSERLRVLTGRSKFDRSDDNFTTKSAATILSSYLSPHPPNLNSTSPHKPSLRIVSLSQQISLISSRSNVSLDRREANRGIIELERNVEMFVRGLSNGGEEEEIREGGGGGSGTIESICLERQYLEAIAKLRLRLVRDRGVEGGEVGMEAEDQVEQGILIECIRCFERSLSLLQSSSTIPIPPFFAPLLSSRLTLLKTIASIYRHLSLDRSNLERNPGLSSEWSRQSERYAREFLVEKKKGGVEGGGMEDGGGGEEKGFVDKVIKVVEQIEKLIRIETGLQ